MSAKQLQRKKPNDELAMPLLRADLDELDDSPGRSLVGSVSNTNVMCTPAGMNHPESNYSSAHSCEFTPVFRSPFVDTSVLCHSLGMDDSRDAHV